MSPSVEDVQKLQKQLDDAQALVKATQSSITEALLQVANQAEPRSPRHPVTLPSRLHQLSTRMQNRSRFPLGLDVAVKA